MDRPPQKISPVSPPPRPWYAMPVSVRQEASGLSVRVEWGRLALILFGCALAAWLAVGTGAYLWVKYRRGFGQARLVDVLFPHRWADYRLARGNFYINKAQQEIAAQQWSEAIHHLRVGLATAPANTEGRLALAQFFVLAGRIELAERTLVEGLTYASENPNYLKALFGFLLQYQEDNEVLRIATELLPAQPLITPRNQLIAIAAANAHLFRGNYDAAESLIRGYQLLQTASLDGRLLLSRIEWERGHSDQAITLLKGYSAQFPDREEFCAQLASYYRELGDAGASEKYALLRTLAQPQSVAARIDLLRAYQQNHKQVRYAEDVESILRNFGDDRTALYALAEFGTNAGDAALTLRVYRQLQARNLDTDAAALMVAESYIVGRDYRAGLAFIQDLGRTRPEWSQRFAGIVNGLQAVASYGLGQRDDGDLYLAQFLGQTNLRVENLVAIANRLVTVGAKAEARRVLAQTYAANPRNQAALTRLVELDLERGPNEELAPNLRHLLTMRRPSSDLLRRAHARLNSDQFLFTPEREELLGAIENLLGPGVSAAKT